MVNCPAYDRLLIAPSRLATKGLDGCWLPSADILLDPGDLPDGILAYIEPLLGPTAKSSDSSP